MDKFCIVGLGNPGDKYKNTRHNVGFIFIDHLHNKFSSGSFKNFHNIAEYSSNEIGGKKLFFLKPITYMNNSGIAVEEFLKYNNILTSNMIIIYDDVDTECGMIRIRKKGSDGGHNGMKSIISTLKTTEIPRIRVGIGPKKEQMDLSDYVLSNFTSSEIILINKILKIFPQIVDELIKKGIDFIMNKYNNFDFKTQS